MKNQIFATNENYASTALRVLLGVIIFSHGAQSMLGWFGGYGLEATLHFLTTAMSLPWIVAFLVILIQFFGPVMLLLGAGTRIAALGLFGIFVGMATYHFQFGLHMNWAGSKGGEGFEYHILVLGMCAALLILGGGALSIDRKITAKLS
jgi:putative oxidoreductase